MIDQKENTLPAPWEPYRLMSYMFFITVIGAGILLGLNWKRLGKPEWQWTTILISILLPLIMIALAIGWIIVILPHRDLPIQLVLSIPLLVFGINIGYLWALSRLQDGAYKKFKKDGPSALQNHVYDVDGALFFGGIVAILVAILGVFITPLIR